MAEPDAGSNPGAKRTTAVRRGNHYLINGYRRWITGTAGADVFPAFRRNQPDER